MSIRRSNIYESARYIDLDILPASLLENPSRSPGFQDTPYMRTLSPDVVCVRGGGWAVGRETGKMRIAEMDRCLEPESYVSAI